MAVGVLWLFLAVPWVALQCVIVVFSDHTHLLFEIMCNGIAILSRGPDSFGFLVINVFYRVPYKLPSRSNWAQWGPIGSRGGQYLYFL